MLPFFLFCFYYNITSSICSWRLWHSLPFFTTVFFPFVISVYFLVFDAQYLFTRLLFIIVRSFISYFISKLPFGFWSLSCRMGEDDERKLSEKRCSFEKFITYMHFYYTALKSLLYMHFVNRWLFSQRSSNVRRGGYHICMCMCVYVCVLTGEMPPGDTTYVNLKITDVQAGTDLEECEELLKYPDLCTSYMALCARTSPAGCTVLASADIAQYGYL
mgnify:CR=1 FL=1